MPLIRLEFDDSVVQNSDVEKLSKAVRDIVSEETAIEDVFVYANSASIKVQVAPIEIFIEMSAHKIDDLDTLLRKITQRMKSWKEEFGFTTLINLTLIPMNWKMEIGI